MPAHVRRQVLTESGYRCGVPTCRAVIPIELHHLVAVRDGGSNEVDNLLPLCPNCHALYEGGTIPRSALDAYKSILVALTHALDQQAINDLLFLRWQAENKPNQLVQMSGDGLLIFRSLIAQGLVDFGHWGVRMGGFGGGIDSRYVLHLTEKGNRLIDAWKAGNKQAFVDIQIGNAVVPVAGSEIEAEPKADTGEEQ